MIASVRQALTHPCPMGTGPSRVDIGDASADFLADLHRIAGVAFRATAPTTLDGYPALETTVDVRASMCNYADLHWPNLGLGPGLILHVPSRLTVADVEGETVLVQIWAATEADLAAWIPVATPFVDSIHFIQLLPLPTPHGTPTP